MVYVRAESHNVPLTCYSFPFHFQGRYIPLFASEVYDQNARLVEAGLTPINLTSIIIGMAHTRELDCIVKSTFIGNGWTDVLSTILSYYDMVCTAASVQPIVDIA